MTRKSKGLVVQGVSRTIISRPDRSFFTSIIYWHNEVDAKGDFQKKPHNNQWSQWATQDILQMSRDPTISDSIWFHAGQRRRSKILRSLYQTSSSWWRENYDCGQSIWRLNGADQHRFNPSHSVLQLLQRFSILLPYEYLRIRLLSEDEVLQIQMPADRGLLLPQRHIWKRFHPDLDSLPNGSQREKKKKFRSSSPSQNG